MSDAYRKLGLIAKRKINAKAAARKLKKPDRTEKAENAFLAASAEFARQLRMMPGD